MKKEKAPALSRRRTAASVLLPVVPAAAFRGAHEEAEHPEDQPDDEQNPEDVKRWCQQTTPTQEQQQQDQNDQRNHSRFTSFRANPNGASRELRLYLENALPDVPYPERGDRRERPVLPPFMS